MRVFNGILLLAALAVLCLPPQPVSGQDFFLEGGSEASLNQMRRQLSEMLEFEKRSITDTAGLSDEQKKELGEYVLAGERHLDRAGLYEAERKNFSTSAQLAEQKLESLRTRLAKEKIALRDMEQDFRDTVEVGDLERTLRALESELERSEQVARQMQREPSRRAARLRELNGIDDRLRTRLSGEDLPVSGAATELVARLQGLAQRAERFAIDAQLRAHSAERDYYLQTDELVAISRDIAVEIRDTLAKRIAALHQQVTQRRAEELSRFLAAMEQAELKSHSAYQLLADGTVELAKEAERVSEEIVATRAQLESTSAQVQQIQTAHAKWKEQIAVARLSHGRGEQLRRERVQLPKKRLLAKRVAQREMLIANRENELQRWQDERADLVDIRQSVERLLAEAEQRVPQGERISIGRSLTRQFQVRKDFIDALLRDYRTLIDLLVSLNDREQQLGEEAADYADFIDRQVLWLKSASPLSLREIPPALSGLNWILSWSNWRRAAASLWADIESQFWIWLAALIAFGLALRLRGSAKRAIEACGADASRPGQSSLRPTLAALALTGYVALIWPLLLLFVFWRLAVAGGGNEFAAAVSNALYFAAVLCGLGGLVAQVCRPKGIGESHFYWPTSVLKSIRSALYRLLAAALPLFLLSFMFDARWDDQWRNSLGRICFMLGCLIMAVYGNQLLHPRKGILAHEDPGESEPWTDRLRKFWHFLLLAILAGFILLAWSGYYSTARVLFLRLIITLYLAVTLTFAKALISRWVILRRRQLLQQQKKRRQEGALERERVRDSEEIAVPESTMDAHQLGGQAAKLISLFLIAVGLLAAFRIWESVLPALWQVGTIAVWPAVTHLTLGDLATAAAIMIIGVIAVKNLPGLLEFLFLHYLPFDAGARYATVQLVRYAIVLVGTAAFFSTLGISWSSVQWLLAAVSVGVGFGLQEIVANFISGIILLFERPMRPGDIVTMKEVTGKVRKISMRGTTITDWDCREHVIPNKDFITQKLVNWTLTDTLSRTTINVSVVHGSDPDLVRELLLKIGTEHPLVLTDPAPHALFDGFGENGLMFVLRVYANLDSGLKLRHELHTRIAQTLQEAGIEIAVPQRVVYMREGLDESEIRGKQS